MGTGRGSLGSAEHTLGTAAVVYSVLTAKTKTLHQHIFYTCPTIPSHSGTSERVRQSMIRHVHACTQVQDTMNICYELWFKSN